MATSSAFGDRKEEKAVWLDFNPGLKGLVRLAGWLWFACAAIFAVQLVLLVGNWRLLSLEHSGDFAGLLSVLAASPGAFTAIHVNFVILRTIYVVTTLGYLAATWRLNRGAALAFAGFAALSLPIIILSQTFQLSYVSIAKDWATADAATKLALQASAKAVSSMCSLSDTLVNVFLFDGIFAAWVFLASKEPHPRYFVPWIVVLAVLPFSQFVGLSVLGLANALLTGAFFIPLGLFMLRMRPISERSLS
jgi:hypothetical protein